MSQRASQPQPVPYYPSPPQPHSHDKFIAGIIIAVVVTAVIAGAIGYGLGSLGRTLGTSPEPATGFTLLHGTVSASQRPTIIYFYNTTSCYACRGAVSASVVSGAYSTTLRSGILYSVMIGEGQGTYGGPAATCNANPGSIAPSGADETQNFSC